MRSAICKDKEVNNLWIDKAGVDWIEVIMNIVISDILLFLDLEVYLIKGYILGLHLWLPRDP